jgi:hypothetical protein
LWYSIDAQIRTYQWISRDGGLFDFTDPEFIRVMGQVFAKENRVTS